MSDEGPISGQGLDGADPDAGRADRRTFLKRAGVVGAGVAGAAWVAPSMLSLDQAFAAGTCAKGLGTAAWLASLNHTRVTTGVAATSASAAIDVRVTGTTVNNVPAAPPLQDDGLVFNNWMVRTSNAGAETCGTSVDYPMGGVGSFYSLEMAGQAGPPNHNVTCNSAGVAGRSVSVTFGFFTQGTTTPHPVTQLSFSLLDVDTIAGDYVDKVQIFLNGSPTVAATGSGSVFPTVVRGPAPTVTQPNSAQATFVGGGTATENQTFGNVTLTSDTTTPISTVTILFTDMLGGAPQTIQWVGISNMTFCKV